MRRIGFLLVILAACSNGNAKPDASPMVCIPGASVACVGKGGCNGAQTCNATGSALDACDCGNADSGMDAMDDGGDTSSGACVAAFAGGYDFTCALKVDGSVWCWGANDFGQLGNGTKTPSTTPVLVTDLGKTVTQISATSQFACARKGDGTAWCWGFNSAGQLGAGTTSMGESTPVQVSLGSVIAEISAASAHACARKNDGTVWCFGSNNSGALGTGSTTNIEVTPVQMLVGTNVVTVSATINHTCVAKSDGTVWCAGSNSEGQLGDGTQGGPSCGGGSSGCKPTPTQTSISNVATN